ncbi:MAG: deoxyribose-phosphate aldolase [Acidimicrobiales bacterium]
MSTHEPATEHRRLAALRTLALIDLTSLGENDVPADIDVLCDGATTSFGEVAAVCVWPQFVSQAVGRLAGTDIDIAAVANFPAGDADPALAIADAKQIVADGGTEVDVVYPWRSLALGDVDAGPRLVAATRQAIGPDVGLKVILETGELVEEQLIRTAAMHALDAGADFLKTSTGKTARSATPEAAAVLLDVLASYQSEAGIKISGGVRTVDQAVVYLDLADRVMGSDWVSKETFRFGASSLLGDVLAALST